MAHKYGTSGRWILCTFLTVVLIATLTACGNTADSDEQAESGGFVEAGEPEQSDEELEAAQKEQKANTSKNTIKKKRLIKECECHEDGTVFRGYIYEYDDNGIQYGYCFDSVDENGNYIFDDDHYRVSNEYDAEGKLVKACWYFDGVLSSENLYGDKTEGSYVTGYGYNADGSINRTTETEYDANGKMIRSRELDANGELIAISINDWKEGGNTLINKRLQPNNQYSGDVQQYYPYIYTIGSFTLTEYDNQHRTVAMKFYRPIDNLDFLPLYDENGNSLIVWSPYSTSETTTKEDAFDYFELHNYTTNEYDGEGDIIKRQTYHRDDETGDFVPGGYTIFEYE